MHRYVCVLGNADRLRELSGSLSKYQTPLEPTQWLSFESSSTHFCAKSSFVCIISLIYLLDRQRSDTSIPTNTGYHVLSRNTREYRSDKPFD